MHGIAIPPLSAQAMADSLSQSYGGTCPNYCYTAEINLCRQNDLVGGSPNCEVIQGLCLCQLLLGKEAVEGAYTSTKLERIQSTLSRLGGR